jgi:succinate dehydrogenase/fumarate reductase cytochrome b subunit
VRIAVLLVVIMHAMAGIRVMLTDVGLAERWHRGLVWILAACGLVIFLYFWLWHV